MLKQFYELFKESYVMTFDDQKKGRSNLLRSFPMSEIRERYDELKQLNLDGAGIFMSVNPCKGGRKTENVTSIEFVVADMDSGTKEEQMVIIKSCKIQPDIIVESKRGYHLYWKVKCDLKSFKKIIGGVISFMESDPAISSPNEVLRLPGFMHMKDGNDTFVVSVIKLDIHEHTIQEMLEAFPFDPPKSQSMRSEDPIIKSIRDIPIRKVLESLGVEMKGNYIIHDGEVTSAHVNEKGNYINRFSGLPGSGSTIDACITYGGKELREAVEYLKGMLDVKILNELLSAKSKTEEIDVKRIPFTWGTSELDKKISPIQSDSFIIFAGVSGHGKTSFSFDMAIKNALLGHRVLYLSLEMSTDAIYTRIAREYSGITKEQWREKSLIKENQRNAYHRKKKELNDIKLLKAIGFGDTDPTLKRIFDIIRLEKPDLVFLDNFDLIQVEGKSEYENQNQIAKSIMQFCHSNPMPMIVIHHMRKGNDKDKGHNQIRGSGKIIHDSDMVVVGARPEAKGGWDNMTEEDRSCFMLIQIKDRDFGTCGMGKVVFHKGSFYDTKPVDNYQKAYEEATEIFNK